MKKILVVNAGSSSLKWTLFDMNLEQSANGIAERIGVDGKLNVSFNGEKHSKNVEMKNHIQAVKEILAQWKELKVIEDINDISIIGFRVVHGGTYYTESVKIDADVIDKIKVCSAYAPLHNPAALSAIEAFQTLLPNAQMTASFDTSFHQTMPKVSYSYPINKEIVEKYGVRKFGFHGTSHEFITLKMEEILNKKTVNIVNLHIGNGASLCAIKDSKSYDTSMGMTPLAGVMMGTRSGEIDPSLVEYIMNAAKMTVGEVTEILNKKSGMLGVSGISSDMREIENEVLSGNKIAIEAHDLYCQRLIDYAAAYINKLGSVDAITFTAGVGENDSLVRGKVVRGLATFGLELDEEANKFRKFESHNLISTPKSKIPVYVVRTNEELMIAEDAIKLTKH